MSKAVVLFSGGQDSTTCLFWARQQFDEVFALSLFYGQRHATEIDAASSIVRMAGVQWQQIDLGALGSIGGSALVDHDSTIEGEGGLVDTEMPQGLPTSYVPARNLIFLSFAAAVAVREGAHDIVTGVCQTDFSGYPDCRRPFVDALERTLSTGLPSSCVPMRILTPLMYLTKAESVKLATRLPGCMDALALSVTCYKGERPGCGACPSCELRAKGFSGAGIEDPSLVIG